MRRAFETVAIDRLDRIGELPDCLREIQGGRGMAYRKDRVLRSAQVTQGKLS